MKTSDYGSLKKQMDRAPVSKAVFSLLLTLSIGVFLISGLKLLSIHSTYKQAKDTYSTISESAVVLPAGKDYPEIDFGPLLELNPETKAYIYIPELLEYPIVQGTDNEKYLHTMLNGEYNPSGTLFIDSRIAEGIEAKNCIIYGHNMNDGSMFSSIFHYSDPAFFHSHRDVHIYTPEHHYLYQVVSVYTADVDGFTYSFEFADDAAFSSFLNQTTQSSLVPSDVQLSPHNHLITLSTCLDNGADEYRNVVVLVREREIKD